MLRLLLGHASGLKFVTAPIVPNSASSRYKEVSYKNETKAKNKKKEKN